MQPNEWDTFSMYQHAPSSYKCYLLELPNDQHFHCLLRLFPTTFAHIIYDSIFLQHLKEHDQVYSFRLGLDHFFVMSISTMGCILSYVSTYDEVQYVQSYPFAITADLLITSKAQIYRMYFTIKGTHVVCVRLIDQLMLII